MMGIIVKYISESIDISQLHHATVPAAHLAHAIAQVAQQALHYAEVTFLNR